MKPVFQSNIHDPPASIGNCYRACIASLLEVDIDEVIPFESLEGFLDKTSDEWSKQLYYYLEGIGKRLNTIVIQEQLVPKGFSILTGKGNIGNYGHCVIANNGKQVHDPSGYDIPLTEFWVFQVITSLEQTEIEVYPSAILDRYGEWCITKDPSRIAINENFIENGIRFAELKIVPLNQFSLASIVLSLKTFFGNYH